MHYSTLMGKYSNSKNLTGKIFSRPKNFCAGWRLGRSSSTPDFSGCRFVAVALRADQWASQEPSRFWRDHATADFSARTKHHTTAVGSLNSPCQELRAACVWFGILFGERWRRLVTWLRRVGQSRSRTTVSQPPEHFVSRASVKACALRFATA